MKSSVKVYELSYGVKVLLKGTIEDIRTFMKNKWNHCKYFIEMRIAITDEVEYYTYLDNDINLMVALDSFSFIATELCSVPIEDFQG